MSQVNPPPFLSTPNDFMREKEKRSYFKGLEFTLFQLWRRTGGGEDAIEIGLQYVPTQHAQVAALQQQIGSGDALTCDETGFTVDSTRLTVDMTEA